MCRLMKSSLLSLALCLSLTSCHKDWLDLKRDKSQMVPASLNDLEALIGNSQVMTERMPYLGELASGDFFIDEQYIPFLDEVLRGSYLWTDESYGSLVLTDWNNRHEQIFYSNTVLAALDRIQDHKLNEQWRNLKGSALFYRGWAIYQLAQLFCDPYDTETSNVSPGIPFLLNADVNMKAPRGTVNETYQQIIADVENSIAFLPDRPSIKTRPSKAAAYALLARTYLLMGEYQMSLEYVDNALAIHSYLIDYSSLDTLSPAPFERYNDEVLFRSTIIGSFVLIPPFFGLDPALHRKYAPNDLRRPLYFDYSTSNYRFKGSYDGGTDFFNGIATDELYLIRAECLARLGFNDQSLEGLNQLLLHRFERGAFEPYDIHESQLLISTIINERQKSLCFRGLRWSDIRRLKNDPINRIILERFVNGEQYELSLNNPNYVFYIPEKEIYLNPMIQNDRY